MALSQDESNEIKMVLTGAEESHHCLNDFESGFIESMKTRYESYGDNTFISEKQWRIIRQIYDKVMAE